MCEQLHSALTERRGHISNPLTIKNVKKVFYNTSVLGLIGLYIYKHRHGIFVLLKIQMFHFI